MATKTSPPLPSTGIKIADATKRRAGKQPRKPRAEPHNGQALPAPTTAAPLGLADIIGLLPRDHDPDGAIADWLRRGIAISQWRPVAGETPPLLDPLPPDSDPKGVVAAWAKIGGHLPPGSTPQSAAKLLLAHLRQIAFTNTYVRSLSTPGWLTEEAACALAAPKGLSLNNRIGRIESGWRQRRNERIHKGE
jgi:hypothetical protein